MQHLDEGTIHAYLDSQLAGDAVREVELHLATCAGCRARLESEREIKERAHSLRIKLAWAATVILALGIGWYARELAMQHAQRGPIAVLEPIEARTAPSEAAPTATGERPSARAVAERTPTPTEMGPTPAAGKTPELAGETRKDLRALAAMAVESVPPGPVSGESLDATRWEEVDREEAERRLGGPLAGIPGGQTISIRAGRRDGVAVIRTVQLLPPGLTVELEQTASRNELAIAPKEGLRAALPDHRTEGVSTVWNGFLVVGRGSVSVDSLRALLERLQRAQPSKPDQLRDH